MASWKKFGIVIKPDSRFSFMQSYCMLPTPFCIKGSLYKIYFGTRNSKNQSSVGFALVNLNDPAKILEYSQTPILSPGKLGTYDDNGVLPSCLVQKNNLQYMYSIGFKPGGTTRMDLYGGLALSKDNGENFKRWSEAPILERTKINPYINTAPWVIEENSKYIMYYVSGVEWINKDLPRYNIQIAFSKDLINWERNGNVAIDFEGNENALARPYVIRENNIFKMWFSSKGKSYNIKYAESKDGIKWVRKNYDFPSSNCLPGIDDEMVCYPVVLKHMNKTIMYYNGNNYGKEGICLAVRV